jgi:PAS domain S-box-containing protein
MDRLNVRPFVRQFLAVALALCLALVGIAAAEIVMLVTGQFVAAILILPVVVAARFGGLLVGALTIALQTVFAALMLPPVLRFAVTSDAEVIRLAISVGVSMAAMFIVIRVRNVERQFRAVVTVASEGIWTIDADGRTTYVNPHMADMLGYTPAEMRGRRFSEFVPPTGVPRAEEEFEKRRHGVPQRGDCELVRKDGSILWAHYAGTPLSDGTHFIGALAVVTDITERKRNDATIRQQAEALERANRQKENFLAVLGHELRNPLTPLVTAVTLMEVKGDTTFQRERSVIARQVQHLLRLVNDISDVSRSRHAKLHIRRERVDMSNVVSDAREAVAPLLSEKQHTLDVNVPDGLRIEGDSTRLRQVVVNLLTNAAKYTLPGGRINVMAEAAGDDVVLRVRDNGVGIPADFLPVLFEPFTQKPETLEDSHGGLGLGLAIVQGIVHAHGGTIEAHSDGAGHGSEFVVRLRVVLPNTSAVVDGEQVTDERPQVAEPM